MFDNDTRLRELSLKAIEGAMSDEEFAELALLSKTKQRLREARASMVAEMRQTMLSRGVTIAELFTAEEIAAAVPQRLSTGLRVAQAKPIKPAKPAREPGTARNPWVRQKSGLVLVEVSQQGLNGLPCRYCKGQSFPYYVSKGLKRLDDGQLEVNLATWYTAAGREYFATDEGKIELARLVDYVKTHKLKPQRG